MPDELTLEEQREANLKRAEEVAARVLARGAQALQSGEADDDISPDMNEEWEERRATGRATSFSTELEDVSEVEYRKVRLERVVLVGLRTDQT
ncbi:MAG: GTPase HflX, partial [Scrofimicrobium sp.]